MDAEHHLVGLGSQFFGSDERRGLPGYEGYLNNRSLSIAELLKDAGYHTYISGKWHLGSGAGIFETLGTDNGEAKAQPMVVCGIRWAEVSATPFAQTKQCTGEGGISVPAFVHLPGQIGSLPPMRVFTHVTDVAPTLLALAGATPPSQPASGKRTPGAGPTQEMVTYKGRNVFSISGQSLLPVILGESTSITREEAQFGEEMYGRAAIYSQDLRWKARWTEPPLGPLDGHWELFDMENDRGETTDLSAKNPELLDSLLEQWRSYMTRVGGVEPSKPNGY